MLLAGPLAPLASWSQKPPPDLAERVADRIAATGAVEEQLVQIELAMLAGGSLATLGGGEQFRGPRSASGQAGTEPGESLEPGGCTDLDETSEGP